MRPNCSCHDEPMWWHSRYSHGAWRCSVRERERNQRRYWADPIASARRFDDTRRKDRIARMETQLKELMNA